MKLLHLTACLALLCLFFSTNLSAQLVGGRENGQSAPKEIKASEINSGGFSGDVSLYAGTYSSTYHLGTVSTPSGLDYSATLTYNSSISSGSSLPSSTGIPYGEGWNLDIPTISIKNVAFENYSIDDEREIEQKADACRATANHMKCDANNNQIWKRFEDGAIHEEGRLLWHSPNLSIPGVVSGRLVYKYSTDDLPSGVPANYEHVFALHTFSENLEAYFDGNRWIVVLSDGTQYEFLLKQVTARNAPNQRLGIAPTKAEKLSSILPKTEALAWYCTKISHPDKVGRVELLYNTYGKFDYYQEFKQGMIESMLREKMNTNSFTTTRCDTTDIGNEPYIQCDTIEIRISNWGNQLDLWTDTYKEIYLKEVTTGYEKLEFQHEAMSFPGTYKIPDINDPAVERHDDLYAKVVEYSYGTANNFQAWKRYAHLQSGVPDHWPQQNVCSPYEKPNQGDPYYQRFNTSSSNPYKGSFVNSSHLNANLNYYWRENIDGSQLNFNHGYLESPRIGTDLPGGDIYELRTRIKNSNKANFDINIASGDLNDIEYIRGAPIHEVQTCDPSKEIILADLVDAERNETIFTTFNQTVKWNPSYKYYALSNDVVETSNFFVLPDLPVNHGGFNVQVGPANADMDYGMSNPRLFATTENHPENMNPIDYPNPNFCRAYTDSWNDPVSWPNPQLVANWSYVPLWPGESVRSNFGIGSAWYGLVDWLEEIDPQTYKYCTGDYLANDFGNSVWFNNEDYHAPVYPQPGWENEPTLAGYDSELQSMELIRYAKIPFMLKQVRHSKINGDLSDPQAGFQLVSAYELDYKAELMDQYIPLEDKPDYDEAGLPVQSGAVLSPHKRNVFLLTSIKQLPHFDPDTPDKDDLPTTHFYYDESDFISGPLDISDHTLDNTQAYRSTAHSLLTKVVNPMGKITELEYAPLGGGSYSLAKQSSRPRKKYLGIAAITSQNSPSHQATKGRSSYTNVFQDYYIIKQKKIFDGSQVRTWDYEFEDFSIFGDYNINNQPDHGNVNHSSANLKAGFGTTTVREPALETGERPYNKHYHDTQSRFLLGKLYKTEAYNSDNELLNKNEVEYEAVLAFYSGFAREKHNRGKVDNDYSEFNFSQLGKRVQGPPNSFEGKYFAHIHNTSPALLRSYFIRKNKETSTSYDKGLANNSREEIQHITEYEYWDAGPEGKSASTGWKWLLPSLNVEENGADRLSWEPSFQLYRSYSYSPQLPDTWQSQEYFYYFDLPNDEQSYEVELRQGPTGDSYHFNTLREVWHNRLSNIAFEKKVSTKKAGVPAQSLSEYYFYEDEWNAIDVLEEIDVPLPAGTDCGYDDPDPDDPTTITECSSPHGNWDYPPDGYCKRIVEDEHLWCPCDEDDENWNYKEIRNFPQKGRLYFKSTWLQTNMQISSEYANNPVSSGFTSTPLLKFDKIDNGDGTFRFVPILPYPSIKQYEVLERYAHGLVQLDQNVTGLQTKYEYDRIFRIRTEICHPDTPTNRIWESSTIVKNLGLPTAITVGHDRPDALTTTYAYNPDYSVQNITDPNGMVLAYEYDDFGRMERAFQNGDKLNEVAYQQWQNDHSLSFEDRALQNYVTSRTLNGGNSYIEATAYVDPMGRGLYAETSSSDNPNVVIRSGKTDFDAWGRATRSYKPFLASTGLGTTPAHSEQLLEKDQRSRPLKSAKFGLDIAGNKVVQNQYYILTANELQLELGLNASETSRLLPADLSAYRLLASSTLDEDGKEMTEYSNASGQKIASLRSNGGQKVVTQFLYDSRGQLTTVINPENQESQYRYNILGQLYEQETVDGGFTRNIYGLNGQIKYLQDEEGRQNGYLRSLSYDAYARPMVQQKQVIGNNPDPFANFSAEKSLAWQNANVGLYNYESNKEKSWVYDGNIDLNDATLHGNSLEYLHFSLSNTKGKPTMTTSYNAGGEPIEYRFISYDDKGRMKWEMTQFNYNGISENAKGLLVRMDYPEYNRQGSLLTQNIDLDGDKAQDFQYHYQYDGYNRLKDIYVSYDDRKGSGHKVAEYKYDEVLGLVTELNYFDSNNNISNYPVDQVTYDYDIRDRLRQLNSHLFEWQLFYDANNPAGSINSLTSQNWNGNINASKGTYKTSNATNTVANFNEDIIYNYTYDGLNRLTNADATLASANINTGGGGASANYGDAQYSYDKIGNLMSLDRWLRNNQGVAFSNNQTYGYGTGNNRLLSLGVTGSGIGSLSLTYTYDNNGNLLTDSKRQITETVYGRANLPLRVKVGAKTVNYLYDMGDMRIYKNEVNESDLVLNAEYYLRSAAGKDLGVVDLAKGELTWYVHGKERLAKLDHQLDWTTISSNSTFARANEVDQQDELNQSKSQAIQSMGSNNDEIALPDELHLLLFGDGSRKYYLESQIASLRQETTDYTIEESIALVSETQQLVFGRECGSECGGTTTVLISLKELKGMTGQEDPPILSSADPFENALSQPQNPPIPEFVFYIYDHLGNTRVTYSTVHDGSAVVYTVKGAVDYFPYGKVLREYHDGEVEKYLSTQHERDQETGLDYRGARFYDSDVARFLSLDPLASKFVSWSSYNYVMGNPIILVDPDGRSPDDNMYINEQGHVLQEGNGNGKILMANVNQEKFEKLKAKGKLDSKFKEVKNKITSKELNDMWEKSNPDVPIDETSSDGRVRKEQSATIILDIVNYEIRLNEESDDGNDYETSKLTMRPSGYLDVYQTQLVIGQIHTHPNREEEGYQTTPAGNVDDQALARRNGIPIYYFDHNHMDKLTPNSRQSINNYQDVQNTLNGSFNLGYDAIKTYGKIN